MRAQADSASDSATQLALDAQMSDAQGTGVRVADTAAREIAAGLVSRAFASATVENDRGVLTPHVLSLMGRGLIVSGMATFLLRGPPFRLIPSAATSFRGTEERASWTFLLSLAGPSDHKSVWYSASQVVHIAANASAAMPWHGKSPFDLAKLSAETMTYSERSARDESKVASARVGVVSAPDDAQRDSYTAALKRGGVTTLSSAANPLAGGGIEKARDYSPGTMRPEPTDAHVQLRRDSLLDMLSAAGIPPSLVDPRADGTSQRESYRRFLHACLQPMARLAVVELREKLESDVSISFRRLAAGDLAARTRSVKQLTEAGLSLDAALSIVQLIDGDG